MNDAELRNHFYVHPSLHLSVFALFAVMQLVHQAVCVCVHDNRM